MKENKSKRYWQNRKKKKMQALAPKSTGIMGFFKKIIDFFTPKSKSNTTSINRSAKPHTKKEQVTGAKKNIYT